MRLLACPACHAQYDVSSVGTDSVTCTCGETIPNRAHKSVDATMCRCASCGAVVHPDADACGYCSSAVVRDTHKLSLICPECWARNPEGAGFCTGCGVRFEPRAVPDANDTLVCPACSEKMPRTEVAGVDVHECPRCHGLWVGHRNFDRLVRSALEVAHADLLPGMPTRRSHRTSRDEDFLEITYRSCPRCNGRMQRKNFGGKSGIIVDWCGADGTFLDVDELESIAEFIRSGQADVSRVLRETPGFSSSFEGTGSTDTDEHDEMDIERLEATGTDGPVLDAEPDPWPTIRTGGRGSRPRKETAEVVADWVKKLFNL